MKFTNIYPMNIETFHKQINRLHDRLFEEADKILKEFNPCQHKTVKKQHSCLGKEKGEERGVVACCCLGCKFWNHGCTANKPLACKTWLCKVAAISNPRVKTKLKVIAEEAVDLHLYVVRGDKKDSIAQSVRFFNYEECQKRIVHTIEKLNKKYLNED